MTTARRLRAQWIVGTIGVLVGFAVFLGGAFAVVVWWRGPEFVGTSTAVMGGISSVIGWLLFQYAAGVRNAAEKRLAPDAATAMARDPRPPILYQRSFADDEVDEPMRTVSTVQRGLQGGAV